MRRTHRLTKGLLLAALTLAPTRAQVSRAELTREIDRKIERVRGFLKRRNLAGVLLTRVDNFSWITAGMADNHIVITS